MSPWYVAPNQDQDPERLSRAAKGVIVFRIASAFVGTSALFLAALAFSGGGSWVKTSRHLAMAILFGLLAAKGPQVTSASRGVKLLVIAAGLVYLILQVVQIVMEFVPR